MPRSSPGRATAGHEFLSTRSERRFLAGLAQGLKRSSVRRFDQLPEIRRGKAGNTDDGNPMKASTVSGGFDARDIRQLDEAIGRDAHAEAPAFRLTRLEIRELLGAHGVDEKVVGLAVQRFAGAGKTAAERFQLGHVHERDGRSVAEKLGSY